MKGEKMTSMTAPAAWVYLVRCRDGSLYCGWTTDPVKRLKAHNSGKGAAYTRSRKPVTLVWCEVCADRSAALRREIAIKRLSRTRKLALIAQAEARGTGAQRTAAISQPN